MKKLVKSVMMLSIASVALLSSCSKTDSNADVTDVKVDMSSSPATPLTNSVITLTVTSTGNVDNKLKSISVTRNDGKVLLSKSLSGTTSTDVILDTLGSQTSYTYTAAVTGEKGSPATKTITVATHQPAGPIDVPNPVPLFGQTNDAGNNDNFVALADPYAPFSTTTFAANKDKVDLAFYYGTNNKATLSGPQDAVMQGLYSGLTWTGVNTTVLYKTTLTANDFTVIVTSASDSAITALASTVQTWVATVPVLAANDVLLYKRVNGKVGLIKINSIENTDNPGSPPNGNNALIYISIVSQKP